MILMNSWKISKTLPTQLRVSYLFFRLNLPGMNRPTMEVSKVSLSADRSRLAGSLSINNRISEKSRSHIRYLYCIFRYLLILSSLGVRMSNTSFNGTELKMTQSRTYEMAQNMINGKKKKNSVQSIKEFFVTPASESTNKVNNLDELMEARRLKNNR